MIKSYPPTVTVSQRFGTSVWSKRRNHLTADLLPPIALFSTKLASQYMWRPRTHPSKCSAWPPGRRRASLRDTKTVCSISPSTHRERATLFQQVQTALSVSGNDKFPLLNNNTLLLTYLFFMFLHKFVFINYCN